jgi:hypothetical protein
VPRAEEPQTAAEGRNNFNVNGNSVGRGCSGLKAETTRIRQRQLRKLCELQRHPQNLRFAVAVNKAFALAVAVSVPFPAPSVASAFNAVAVAVADAVSAALCGHLRFLGLGPQTSACYPYHRISPLVTPD